MFCENCGTKNPEVARFCENCGTPVSAAPVTPAGGTVAAAQKKTKAGVIIIALVLIAALAAGAYFLFFKDKGDTDTNVRRKLPPIVSFVEVNNI